MHLIRQSRSSEEAFVVTRFSMSFIIILNKKFLICYEPFMNLINSVKIAEVIQNLSMKFFCKITADIPSKFDILGYNKRKSCVI